MIYQHTTVELYRGKTEEWVAAIEKHPHFYPLLEKHGLRMVGAWQTTVGNYDEVVHLYAFDSLAERERFYNELSQIPELIQQRKTVLKLSTPLVKHEYTKLMVPLPYSPMK